MLSIICCQCVAPSDVHATISHRFGKTGGTAMNCVPPSVRVKVFSFHSLVCFPPICPCCSPSVLSCVWTAGQSYPVPFPTSTPVQLQDASWSTPPPPPLTPGSSLQSSPVFDLSTRVVLTLQPHYKFACYFAGRTACHFHPLSLSCLKAKPVLRIHPVITLQQLPGPTKPATPDLHEASWLHLI